jgi:hypothetical protein
MRVSLLPNGSAGVLLRRLVPLDPMSPMACADFSVRVGPGTVPHRRLIGNTRNDIAFHTATRHKCELSQICWGEPNAICRQGCRFMGRFHQGSPRSSNR